MRIGAPKPFKKLESYRFCNHTFVPFGLPVLFSYFSMNGFLYKLHCLAAHKNQYVMKKIILKYGLISGVIIAVLMLTSWAMMQNSEGHSNLGMIIGYASMILSLSMVFLGIRTYRANYTDGSLTFLEAFKVGILISVLAGLVYVASWMVYYSVGGGQEMMADYFNSTVEKLMNSDLDPSKLDKKLKEMDKMQKNYANPLFRAGLTFMEMFPVGLIITVISALILKRKKEAVSRKL